MVFLSPLRSILARRLPSRLTLVSSLWEGGFMEAVVEQGTLFPLVEQRAQKRGFLREFVQAVEKHGPLVFRASVHLILDVSRQRVHQLVEQGRIATVEIRGHQYVPVASLEAYFADERKDGRPPLHPWLDEVKWLHRLTDQQKKFKKTA